MIRGMISQKQAELANHVSKSAYCDSELPKSKAELEKVQAEIDENTADRDRLTAKIAQMKEDNDDLSAAMAKTQQNISDSQAKRDSEKAAYEEAKAKYEAAHGPDSDEAVKAQIKVETEEASRQFAFRRWNTDAVASIKADEKTVQLNGAAIVKMKSELAEAEKDGRMQEDLLKAAKGYKTQLEKQCVVRTESYAERARRRDEEIESMKDAYEILGGDNYGL